MAKTRGRKPSEPGTRPKTYKMPPAALAQLARLRAYHGLTTDTAAVLFALALADRALPAGFTPPAREW
jgi:hypothetical protein